MPLSLLSVKKKNSWIGCVDCRVIVLSSTATGVHNLYPASYPTNYQLFVSTALIVDVAIAPRKGIPTLSQPLKES